LNFATSSKDLFAVTEAVKEIRADLLPHKQRIRETIFPTYVEVFLIFEADNYLYA